MRTRLLFLSLNFVVLTVQAQTTADTASKQEDADVIVTFRPFFYLESGQSFLASWPQEKSCDFHFCLFNRWGEWVAESFDPKFEIDDALCNTVKLKTDRYIYQITYTDSAGVTQKIFGHIDYIGYYCTG